MVWVTCFEVSPSDSPGATKEEPDSAVGKKLAGREQHEEVLYIVNT